MNVLVSLYPRHGGRLGDSSARRAAHGATEASGATRIVWGAASGRRLVEPRRPWDRPWAPGGNHGECRRVPWPRGQLREVQGPLAGPVLGMVGVLGDAWPYWAVPLTSGKTQRGYWGIPWPLKKTRGTAHAGVYIA